MTFDSHNPAYDPSTEELTFLAGDRVVSQTPDAWDGGPIGRSNTMHLEKAALGHPFIRYQDALIEADVYPMLSGSDAGAAALEVILICPRCRHELRVTSDRKAIDWTPGAPEIDLATQQAVVRGSISIERFQCTWEIDTAAGMTTGGKASTNLCRWRVVVDKGIAKDA